MRFNWIVFLHDFIYLCLFSVYVFHFHFHNPDVEAKRKKINNLKFLQNEAIMPFFLAIMPIYARADFHIKIIVIEIGFYANDLFNGQPLDGWWSVYMKV